MSYSNKNRSNSNLERFLDCITPSIPAQFLQKQDCFNENRLWGPFDDGSSHYFKLGDLWNCYDEWSAYGAGVPILLNSKETVVQYYVPYLSALQIYTSSSSNRSISDGECCDYDLRDCSLNGGSETSSEDCESSTANLSDERLPSFRSCNYSEKSVSWDGSGFEECVGGGGGVGVEQEHWWRPQDRLGYLYLEYFENSSPYARVPLMEKINQLSRGYPELHSLRSIDLSPASWMSVAWYPIYHIPTSRFVKDLSASFLTYHTLSFSFQDNDSVMVNGDGNKDWAENIRLPPFGAATYKLHGNVWFSGGGEDHQRLYSLWSAALSWLNQLHLQHPDFRFFLGHRN